MAGNPQSRPPLPRRLARLAGFLTIQLLVILLLLEVVGRVADPLGISYYRETARYLDTMLIEEPIGYRNRPGLTGRFYGATVEINSLGLRDRELDPSKDPGEFRILVMGDSLPFGIGVEFDESIGQGIERLANRDAGQERRYRTVNMGVISYNTEQERIQLENTGLGLQPDLVLVFFADNDIEPKMWVFDKRASWYADLAQRSAAAGLVFVLKRKLGERLSGERQRINTGAYRAEHPRWRSCAESLAAMNRLCREAGIPFVVFARATRGGKTELLQAVGGSEGFPVVLIDRLWAPQERSGHVNSAVDGHPNREGSALFARFVHDELTRRGLLQLKP